MKKIYLIIIVQLCAILSFAQNWNVTMMRVTRLTTSQGCTDAFGSPDYGWGLRTTTSYYDSDIDNGMV